MHVREDASRLDGLMDPHEKMAIDSYKGSYEHTKLCGHMLTSDRDVQLHAINTIILVKYKRYMIK